MTVTYILIAVVAGAALVALAAALQRRAGELLLYVGVSVVGYLVLSRVGSPWVDAKALATASPAPVTAGIAGAAFVFERGRRVEAAVLAAAIGGGVLWSNSLAYHTVWLAPRPRLAEIEKIGHRFAGDGPTLTTDYELYGVRYFLRKMDPDGAAITGSRPLTFVGGGPADGEDVDVDRISLDSLLVYRTLVLRRSPAASRPPSSFALVSSGRYYEVWQQGTGKILRHLPLGTGYQPAAVPSCADVLQLADLAARNGGRLATVPRPPALVTELSQPGGPIRAGEDPAVAYLSHQFTLQAPTTVPATGRYGVWVGGSFRSRLEVSVDGRRVGAKRDQLNWPGDFTQLGNVVLRAGSHAVTLHYDGPDLLHPGSAGQPPFGTGPLILAQGTADRLVQYVQPQDAHTLCGKRLDWVEAVAP